MKINSKIFKAYDIRGRYPSEINEKAVAWKLTSIRQKLKTIETFINK